MRARHAQKIEFSIAAALDRSIITEPVQTGTIADVSSGGIGFFTHTPLEPGTVLRFRNVPSGEAGVVMWTVKTDDRYRVGVRFTDDNEPASQRTGIR